MPEAERAVPNPVAPVRRRRGWMRACAILVPLAVSSEVSCLVVGRVMQEKWLMFRAPSPAEGARSYAEYLRARDPVLGWPQPDELGGPQYRADGSRPSPANDAVPEGLPTIAVYGDSFVRSHNADEETWENLLAASLGRRVKNFGVGGYGTDQALLRHLGNAEERSTLAVLCLMPENVIRNLTHNRDLLNYRLSYAYKPRYEVDESGTGLRLLPMPRLTESEHRRFLGIDAPWHLLEGENFQPGTPAGVTELKFPFTVSIVRNFSYFRLRAKFAGRPSHAEFYEPLHPFRGLDVTAGIVRSFVRTCEQRGQTPIFAILPNSEDVGYRATSGSWCFDPLVDRLRADGIRSLNFGESLLAAGAHLEPAKYFDASGHYTPLGDSMLSAFLLPVLRDHPALR